MRILKTALPVLVFALISCAYLASCTSESGDGKPGAPGAGGNAGGGAPPAEVPAPVAPESGGMLGYVVVPSLDAAMKGAAEIAASVTPPGAGPAPTAEMMKQQVGAMIGDPQLTSVETDKPILVVAFAPDPNSPMPVPTPVGLFPVKSSSPLDATLTQMGMQSKFADGILTVGQTPQALEAAAGARGLYDRLSTTKIGATARVFGDMDELLTRFGPMIKMMVGMQAQALDGAEGPEAAAGLGALLNAEVAILLALLAPVDSIQLDVNIGTDGIEADIIASAKPGTELATMFTKSRAVRPPTTSLLSSSGSIAKGTYAFDPVSAGAFAKSIFDQVSKDPAAAALMTPELTSALSEFGSWATGTGTMVFKGTNGTMSYDAVIHASDGAKFIDVMEKSLSIMSSGGALAGMYKSMGVDMTASFERDVRKHGETSIHRWTVTAKPAGDAGAAQVDTEVMAKLINQKADIAYVDGHGLMSYDEGTLDRLIDAIRAGQKGSPMELESRAVFGGGGHAYLDYDIVAIIKLFASSLGGGEMADALSKTESKSRPMIAAFTWGTGRARIQWRLPLDFVRDMAAMRQTQVAPKEPAPR